MKKLSLLCIAVSFSFIFNGCMKDSDPPYSDVNTSSWSSMELQTIDHFLDYLYISKTNPNIKAKEPGLRNVDPFIQNVIDAMSQMDSAIMISAADNIGFPIWDQADVFDDSIGMIPMTTISADHMTGIMYAFQKDGKIVITMDSLIIPHIPPIDSQYQIFLQKGGPETTLN